ncbi:MAG: alpha/beta hydrolase [Chitinophagaceae bacterium]|nr:MAG: alpha/beta hydrolase [Chitinophagaceae bacterium]
MYKLLIACASLVAVSCNNADTTKTTTDSTGNVVAVPDTMKNGLPEPKGPKPEWGPSLTKEMQVIIEKLGSYGAAPIETLTPAQARKNPTPTTAVMDLVKENNIPMPAPVADTMGKDIPVAGGMIHARIYTPKGDGPFPVIVYYHGGGWVIADLDTYDASARGLAEQANAVVVSVHYRQAPEFKFPTAHNDAFAAYQWVWKNLQSIKGDSMVAVVGESAGGNLAANVSIMARDKKLPMPVRQVLIYPVASDDMNSESYKKNAAAKPLNKPMMEWFAKTYLPSMAAASDPRIALVKANLKGLPPTTIITAEIDPLQSDGMALRDKLKEAGVDVNFKNYDGVTHEFYGMAILVPEAKDAQALVASDLKSSFKK